jgi:hypothetical protein
MEEKMLPPAEQMAEGFPAAQKARARNLVRKALEEGKAHGMLQAAMEVEMLLAADEDDPRELLQIWLKRTKEGPE